MSSPGDWPDFVAPPSYVYTRIFGSFLSGAGTSIPVGQFSTVHVLLGNVDGTSLLCCNYQFIDSASGFIVDQGMLSADTAVVNPGFPSWNLPVQGDTLKLFPLGTSVIAEVIGTNRALGKGMTGDLNPVRSFQGQVPASSPSGTLIQLLGQQPTTNNAVVQANLSNYNGQVMYVWLASGSISGAIQMQQRDPDGSTHLLSLFFNPTGTTQLQVGGHPFGYVSWWFKTTAVSPAVPVTIQIQIWPAEAAP